MQVDTSRENPRHIFLEPECCADPSIGRCWAAHNEWPLDDCDAQAEATQYVRADLVAALERERDAAIAERDRLTEAFSAIEAECWDVRCIDVPTGCGDADVQWVVIAHYMAAPKEREVGHGTSPLSAIQAALASIKKEPADGE